MDYDYAVEYSQTWSGGLQYELRAGDDGRSLVHGNVDAGRRQRDGSQRAGAWPRPDSGPPADSGTEPNQRDPLRRQVDLPRPDVQAERRLSHDVAFNASYTLSHSKDDASSPGPTESEANVPQNVRNIFDETGEWALSSFDHRHQFIASGSTSCRFSATRAASPRAICGGWRANAVFIAQSGSPFTVNLGVDRANIGAGPAQRPDQLRDPNLPGSQRTPERWFDTGAFALPAPFTFGTAPRNSVVGPGFANMDFALAKTWRVAGRSIWIPLGSLQPLQPGELRPAQPDLRKPELRADLQRQNPGKCSSASGSASSDASDGAT